MQPGIKMANTNRMVSFEEIGLSVRLAMATQLFVWYRGGDS